ncbi:MAG: DUF192 domain-containing protein [Pseudomonadota bacterium]
MKRFVLALSFAILAAPSFAQTAQDDDVGFGEPVPLSIVTENATHGFSVEEAVTPEQQARGMMWRESMGEDEGMIFKYDEPRVATIWMKNTAIPLDILFVRSNGEILKIEHMAQPFKLRTASSEAVVAAVVELKGGRALELGIQPGDTVQHPFFGS